MQGGKAVMVPHVDGSSLSGSPLCDGALRTRVESGRLRSLWHRAGRLGRPVLRPMPAMPASAGGRDGPASGRPARTGACRQAAGPSDLDGANDDLGGDLQAQARGVEHHVEVVRVVRVGAVHGAIELGTAAIEVAGGPPGRADRDPHPLGQTLGADLQGARSPATKAWSRGAA